MSAWRDAAGIGMEAVRRLGLGEQRRPTVRGEVLAADGVVDAHQYLGRWVARPRRPIEDGRALPSVGRSGEGAVTEWIRVGGVHMEYTFGKIFPKVLVTRGDIENG